MEAAVTVPDISPSGRRPRFRHLTTEQLLQLPPPSFLLEPFIVQNALNLIFGPSGTYKSFVIIDWALCIATGTPWHGQPVTQGPVLFVAGEGSGGLPKRIYAWCHAHNQAIPNTVTWIPEAVPLRDKRAVDELAQIIDTMPEPPRLIVVETYARSLAGGNENASEDVGAVVASLDRIRTMTNAAILMSHHTGWEATQRERGHSSLPAALDSSIRVSRPAPLNVTLHCQKAKDSDEFEDVHLTLEPMQGSLVVAKKVDAHGTRDNIRDHIADYVATNPGALTRQILDAVPGRRADTSRVLKAMCEGVQPDIRVERTGQSHHHFLNRFRDRETVGNGSHGVPSSAPFPVPHPLKGNGAVTPSAEPFPNPGNTSTETDPDDIPF